MPFPIRPIDQTVYVHDTGVQYIYDIFNNHWRRRQSGILGGGTGVVAGNQVEKDNVVASLTNPVVVDIPIPATTTYNRAPVEVLKYIAPQLAQTLVIATFTPLDAASYVQDSQVIFDNNLYLRTSYSFPMTQVGPLGQGQLYSLTIDLTQYKNIESVSVS